MLHLVRTVRTLLIDETGATAIEYAFVTMFVTVIFVAAIEIIGTQLNDLFQSAANGLTAANAS
ncbi:MAG TPA: Flp family type IVb pilin [Stellaceae bacterium]|nr:Flp family type IVb pilin [Stellaceae bacterium]